MNVSLQVWLITLVILLVMFVVDFVVVDARPQAFGPRQALRWVVFYIFSALTFAVFVWLHFGSDFAQQFIAGWITEYSLSIDNLFVFIVLMSSFAVPAELKHRVLLIGVAIAIFLRGALILVGAAAIQRFEGTFFVFGGFLLYTALTVWRSGEGEANPNGNAFVRSVERALPVTRDYHQTRMIVRINQRRHFTPMLFVILAVGTTDVLFALDSIPAVFGLTRESYLVFTVNAFALMGLRQLYFLLDGLLAKIIYLSKGLAVILGFIAVKLLLEATHGVFNVETIEITIVASLLFIATTLAVTVIVSLRAVARDPSLLESSEVHDVADDAIELRGKALENLDDLD